MCGRHSLDHGFELQGTRVTRQKRKSENQNEVERSEQRSKFGPKLLQTQSTTTLFENLSELLQGGRKPTCVQNYSDILSIHTWQRAGKEVESHRGKGCGDERVEVQGGGAGRKASKINCV